MRHPGARKSLPERIADLAAVADDERAHLGVLRIGEIAIEERADVVSDRLDLGCRKTRAVADYLERRRAERLRGSRHRRVDSVARHQAGVVELARVSVVVWKVKSRAEMNFVTEPEIPAAERGDSHGAAHRSQRLAPFRCARDCDVQALAVSLALGLAEEAAFDRDW